MKSIFGWRIKSDMLAFAGLVVGNILTAIITYSGYCIRPDNKLWVVLYAFSLAFLLFFGCLVLLDNSKDQDRKGAFIGGLFLSLVPPLNFLFVGISLVIYRIITMFERVNHND